MAGALNLKGEGLQLALGSWDHTYPHGLPMPFQYRASEWNCTVSFLQPFVDDKSKERLGSFNQFHVSDFKHANLLKNRRTWCWSCHAAWPLPFGEACHWLQGRWEEPAESMFHLCLEPDTFLGRHKDLKTKVKFWTVLDHCNRLVSWLSLPSGQVVCRTVLPCGEGSHGAPAIISFPRVTSGSVQSCSETLQYPELSARCPLIWSTVCIYNIL